MQDSNRIIYPKPVRILIFVMMLLGLWSSTFGLKFVFEVLGRCTAVNTEDSFAQWKHWCTTGLVWYLAIRFYLEAIVLAVRRPGSGRVLSPNNPDGLLRVLAGWELIATFPIGVCVVAIAHSCDQCFRFGHQASCDADIGYQMSSMVVGIWALRCLRVTGYSLAPITEWT